MTGDVQIEVGGLDCTKAVPLFCFCIMLPPHRRMRHVPTQWFSSCTTFDLLTLQPIEGLSGDMMRNKLNAKILFAGIVFACIRTCSAHMHMHGESPGHHQGICCWPADLFTSASGNFDITTLGQHRTT